METEGFDTFNGNGFTFFIGHGAEIIMFIDGIGIDLAEGFTDYFRGFIEGNDTAHGDVI